MTCSWTHVLNPGRGSCLGGSPGRSEREQSLVQSQARPSVQAEGLGCDPFKVAGAGEVTDSGLWMLQMVEESVVLVNGDHQDDSGVLCPSAWTSRSASPLGPPRRAA